MKKILILTSFLICIGVIFFQPLWGDGDFFHHINTGRYILTHYQLPRTDEFTFTAYGKPWIGYAWGMGIIFYLLFQYGGPWAVSTFVSLVAILIFLLLFFLIQTYKVTFSKTLLLLSLIIAPLATRFPARPEIVTYVFLILLLLLDRLKQTHPRLSFFYPLIIVVWANTYGSSVILGLGVIVLLLIKQFIDDHWRVLPHRKAFYLALLCSFPAALLNGYGLKSIFYIFYIPSVAQHEGEWYSVLRTLREAPDSYLFFFRQRLLIFVLYIAALITWTVLSRKKVAHYPLENLLAVSLLIPMFAFRQLPTAVILSIPMLAVCFEEIKKKWLMAGTLVVIACSVVITLRLNPIGVGTDTNKSLIDFIKTHELHGRVVNSQQVGAYLTYYLYPEVYISYDTRDELFIHNAILEEYNRQSFNIVPFLQKYHVNMVIIDRSNTQPIKWLSLTHVYRSVFENEDYILFIPQSKL